MFSFFRPKPKLGIVFHIGTSSVGAGLIRLMKGETPHVLYSLRERIPYRENVDPERFMMDMVEALKTVNTRISKEAPQYIKTTEFRDLADERASHVFYVFSSPWSVTQTKVAGQKENKPFKITEKVVDRIIEVHEKMFKPEISSGLKVIEKKVINVNLDGYDVANPYGKEASTANISFLTSLIPEALYEKILEISARTYHSRDTKSFSFTLASFSAIRDVFHSDDNFIFIDIGGEISDITIVENGFIAETASFPLGSHFIIRKVAEAMNISAGEASSIMKTREDGRIDQNVEQKIKPIIDSVSEEWLGGLRAVLEKVDGQAALPRKIFVLANNDLIQLIVRTLRAEKIPEFGTADIPLVVTMINYDTLKDLVTFDKYIDRDPSIALITAFAGRVYESEMK